MNNRLLTDEQLLKLRAAGDIHQAINAQLLYTDAEWVEWIKDTVRDCGYDCGIADCCFSQNCEALRERKRSIGL